MIAFADNPPILTPLALSIGEVIGQWWVARTFSRCEKALAWDMVRAKVPYFLPMVKRVTFSGGRRRVGMMPVFPSYLFLAGTHEQRVEAFQTGHVCQAIVAPEQSILVAELNRVHQVLGGEQTLQVHPQIIAGDRCRMTVGPFAGLEGKIADVGQTPQFLIDLTVLGQSIGLPVENAHFERLTDPPVPFAVEIDQSPSEPVRA